MIVTVVAVRLVLCLLESKVEINSLPIVPSTRYLLHYFLPLHLCSGVSLLKSLDKVLGDSHHLCHLFMPPVLQFGTIMKLLFLFIGFFPGAAFAHG